MGAYPLFTVTELSKQVAALAGRSIDCDEFEDWFRTVSQGAYHRRGEHLSDLIATVEGALSRFQYGQLSEASLATELAIAVAPFERKQPVPAQAKYRLLEERVAWQFAKPSELILNSGLRMGLPLPEANDPILVEAPHFEQIGA